QGAVLVQGGAGGARERLLLGELRGGADEAGQCLEVPQLQVRGLPEEGVELGGELGEIDARGVAVIAPGAERERAQRLLALPEPSDHALSLLGSHGEPRVGWGCSGIGSGPRAWTWRNGVDPSSRRSPRRATGRRTGF